MLGLLTVAIEQTHRESHQVGAQLVTLAVGVSETKPDLGQYKPRLEKAAKGPRQLSANRDTTASATDCPLPQIGELNQKYSASEISWPQGSIAALKLVTLITPEVGLSGSDTLHPEAMITDAPLEPERDTGGVTEPGRPGISEFARVLASAGLNIQRLFSQLGLNRAEGGPLVPPRKGDQLSGIDSDKLEEIRGLIKSLPLSLPLEYFRLESRFGPRRDPFNRRPSFHTGLDLSAPYMSPIYATAPGIITYAGYRGGYGRVVEIDHGARDLYYLWPYVPLYGFGRTEGFRACSDRLSWQHWPQLRTACALRNSRERRTAGSREVYRACPPDAGYREITPVRPVQRAGSCRIRLAPAL